jgi:hypothetical protein
LIDWNAGFVFSASGCDMRDVSSVGTAHRNAGRSRRIVASSAFVSRGFGTKAIDRPLTKDIDCTPAAP